ncbi:ASKHA domain-containing protein [Phaeovulum vinaykumarii]|uniref:Uncharacterized 2Fe-2 and 4Fe-4S clusters-containing protein, contains DUF4445 domain n=1 Tax=Phaeovulum vinaykumarii TaxID=407234 RepID=A0A1N7MGF6_9RHOB|nr:ASKHA domain-containing protein [Phaeovulum vinaykumarii]SIS85234.1 Uncharacterized 2Fe-2 and 4Fe-4S clusters-containing protein, contains DUF4445 domain [Phaeovulum vinaykumarii]SOC12151.1 uncharacterized 2Fe-2S/4Fe-4S cluster protein [Phaeovulum vinaykumarii]
MNDNEQVTVVFTPSGKRGQVARGTTVLQAARALGVDLDSVCGGRGICSKCQFSPGIGQFAKHGLTVTAEALAPPNAVERRYDEKRGLPPGRRLGCQAQILGDLVVDVPAESQLHRQVVRKSASERVMEMDPATRPFFVEVTPASLEHPDGDAQRLAAALAAQWGIRDLEVPLDLLSRMQPILRAADWKVTAAIWQGGGRPRLIDLWPGLRDAPLLGLAIDLGSTTIAGHLVDLADGRVRASAGVMNPQIRFGEDLMSRVSYAMMNPGGAAEMTAAVRAALADLARALTDAAGCAPRDVVEAVLVCNPVMHHLMLGIDPVELGQAPFAPATSAALDLTAAEIGLSTINPAARAYVLPLIAGHVGADAAAVVLSEAPRTAKAPVLIVDVGTNAEIVLGDRTRVLACSSPTGPAFEGAQISSGQRAAAGAIERVRIDPATREPRFRVIGCDLWSDAPGFAEAAPPITGICGSGIIEAVAEMRLAGLVDASGLIGSAEQTGSARCIAQGRTHAYLLHDGPTPVMVTQGDIRAIQLAKSALYAGARLLMDHFGIAQVDRVVLAGAFGAHISPLHAMVLGMIPDCATEAVVSAGNAAGTGARMALCSVAARRRIETEVTGIERIETALEPRFQEHFVAANALPHATDPFPHLPPLPQVSFNTGGTPGGSGGRRRRRAAGNGE